MLNIKPAIEHLKFTKEVFLATAKYPKIKFFIDELIQNTHEKERQFQERQNYINEILATVEELLPEILKTQSKIKILEERLERLENGSK